MRLGRNARVWLRVFPAHTRPAFQHINRLLIAWVLILVLVIALVVGLRRAESVINLVAERHSVNLATRLIHEAVDEQILKHGYAYDDFVSMHTDDAGQVQSLTVNAKTTNQLKAEVALAVEKKISSMTSTSVQVPYAAFISDDASVGGGPRIDLELAPLGYCIVDFENSFTSVGINQTKHQVDIVVKANFAMMMAFAGEGVTVETRLPVAQTVIVGTVPNSYFQIQQ